MSSINVQVLPSKVAVVKFDVPGEKLNVLSTALMTELETTLDALAERVQAGEVAGVVFISGKEDSFFAGANLDEIVPIQHQPSAVAYEAAERGKEVYGKIAALPVPTVCAINGISLGGGTELALACKYRVASSNPKTKIGLPEVALGFLPGWGGTVRLTRLVGFQVAAGLILDPMKTWDADKAWRNGVVDEVVEPEHLLEHAVEIALGSKPKRAKTPFKVKLMASLLERNWLGRKVLTMQATAQTKKATKGQYPAPPAALKVMLASLTMPAKAAFELESRTFASLAVTPESRNQVGIQRATTESKKMPEGVKPLEVKTIGVMGAGVMGAGIAQLALYKGYDVVLYDKFPEGLDKGVKSIRDLFMDRVRVTPSRRTTLRWVLSAALVGAGALFCGWLGLAIALPLCFLVHRHFDNAFAAQKARNEREVDEKVAGLKATTKYEDLKDCDLIIEAIREDMGNKKEAIAAIEALKAAKSLAEGQPANYVFASNTSSLSVTEMASAAEKPENVGAMHFFNPPGAMPLVEVPRAEKTSAQTVATIKAVAAKLGKTSVETTDSTGFVVNRDLAPYLRETIVLMEQGVPLKDIEEAMKKFGMKMGPLALLDEVGLDICAKVIEVMNHSFGDRLKPPAIMEWVKSQKLLGRKGGKGIYLYDKDGRRTEFNPEFLAVLPAPTNKKSLGEIQDRLVLAMVNEGARALDEGVVASAALFDLAMIYGTGFPPFRGGVLRYADSVGVRTVVQKLEWLAKVAGPNYEPAPLLVRMAASGETFYG